MWVNYEKKTFFNKSELKIVSFKLLKKLTCIYMYMNLNSRD